MHKHVKSFEKYQLTKCRYLYTGLKVWDGLRLILIPGRIETCKPISSKNRNENNNNNNKI